MQLEVRKPYQIFEAKSVPESWGIDPMWNYLYSYDNEESAFLAMDSLSQFSNSQFCVKYIP